MLSQVNDDNQWRIQTFYSFLTVEDDARPVGRRSTSSPSRAGMVKTLLSFFRFLGFLGFRFFRFF